MNSQPGSRLDQKRVRREPRKLPMMILSTVLLGAFSFLFREQLLLAAGDILIVEDQLEPADVIHVIAGDDHRTDYAIQLYQRGYARRLFFTGGWCTTHGYWHGQHALQRAVSQGVALEDVVFDESTVTSTYSETVLLKTWIDQSPVPIRSVIVVSDPFHMRRAQWANRKVLGKEMKIVMAPVPFEQTPYQRRWWTEGYSKRFVRYEYQKSAYYLLRYQLSWGWVKDWLASLDRE